MATVDLTPQSAYSSFWINSIGAIDGVNSNVATKQTSFDMSHIIAYNCLSSYTSAYFAALPPDITITGIEVILNAAVSSGYTGDPTFNVYLGGNSDFSAITSIKSTSTLPTAYTTITLGSSGDKWGFETITRGAIDNNSFFCVYIVPVGNPDTSFYLDDILIRVHYTPSDNTLLTGSRSIWKGLGSTTYDVNVLGSSSTNLINPAVNGFGKPNSVRSEEMNRLGDSLLTIESSLLTLPTSSLSVVGGPLTSKTYFVTMTLTGTLNRTDTKLFQYEAALSGPLLGGNKPFYEFRNLDDCPAASSITPVFTPNQANLPEIGNTNLELVFSHISGIGWVNNGGSITPLHVSPQVFCIKDGTRADHAMYLALCALDARVFNTSEAALLASNNYTSVYLTGRGFNGSAPFETHSYSLPSGTVWIKITGIAHS